MESLISLPEMYNKMNYGLRGQYQRVVGLLSNRAMSTLVVFDCNLNGIVFKDVNWVNKITHAGVTFEPQSARFEVIFNNSLSMEGDTYGRLVLIGDANFCINRR